MNAAACAVLGVLLAGPPAALADPLHVAQAAARGMRFEIYIRLEAGMSEGELLSRAGPPDRESADALVKRPGSTEVVKTWTYLATRSDPFITSVTLVGGRISQIMRERQF